LRVPAIAGRKVKANIMPLRNACFVSYRHGQYELMKEFITDFCAALRGELELMLHFGGVYLDHERLKGGDFFNPELARNLYESATMAMIFTPTYFDTERPYCAREYTAMVRLEQERLRHLRATGRGNHGLIIPIVLRGVRYLPDEIKGRRQYHNFEDFQLGSRRLSRHPRFAPVIREIASYICDRYQELRELPDDAFQNGEHFSLPDDTEMAPFLKTAAEFKLPFPRGEISCPEQVLSARS
jgi:hypothetical protein